MRTYLRQLRRSRVMQHRQHRQRRSRVMRRSRVIFDRHRPSVVDLRCPPAAVGRSEALCTNRPYSVDLRSALKQTRRSRVVLGASQICADLGSCGTAAPGNADFGSSPVSMRRFRGSPSAGAEQRRSGVSFARRADLGSFLRICADLGKNPIYYTAPPIDPQSCRGKLFSHPIKIRRASHQALPKAAATALRGSHARTRLTVGSDSDSDICARTRC